MDAYATGAVAGIAGGILGALFGPSGAKTYSGLIGAVAVGSVAYKLKWYFGDGLTDSRQKKFKSYTKLNSRDY
jgi:uncharacterized protein YcfJ